MLLVALSLASVSAETEVENRSARKRNDGPDPRNPERALLVSAINGILDSHTSRMAVIYDRLPTAVLALLVLIASASLGVAAFNSSLRGHPSRWRMSAFALILASLMYIILDYDMMMRGLIQVDHRRPRLADTRYGGGASAVIRI